MKYTRFEDLPCWQKARELCRAVFKIISVGPLARDFALRDQIWRSSGSVMDNIAEGFDDYSNKEFLKFLGYSLRSCSEAQSQLYRTLDCGYISQEGFNEVYGLAEDCKIQIKSFMKYLRNR